MNAARSVRSSRSDPKSSSSARLGARLRTVLVSPRSGFRNAMGSGVAERAAESRLTTLLVLLGGSALILLWLKVTALTIADRPQDEVSTGFTLIAVVLGALCGAVGYLLWGRLGPRVARRYRNEATSAQLRLAWSFADFPIAAYVCIFLPLDLLVVGPEIFSSDRLEGTFPMVWAALSVALLLSATAWTAFLLWRGIEAAVGTRGAQTLVMMLTATACYAVVLVLVLAPMIVLERFFG